MRRCTIGLFALTLLATACGSSGNNEDVLVALGLNETEAECFDREYSDRGLDMNTLLTADTDDLSSQELQAVHCGSFQSIGSGCKQRYCHS